MTNFAIAPRFILALTLLASPLALQAQDDSGLSAAEIIEKFEEQRTRGLVIAPSTGVAPDAVEGEEVDVVANETYIPGDEASQINIRIAFDFDSAALNGSEKVKLAAMCEAMQISDIDVFRIVGHTDASGTASYNERLSLLRAQEVKRHLISECGIAETRLEAIGVGESSLFDTADPRSDANRRVEFQFVS